MRASPAIIRTVARFGYAFSAQAVLEGGRVEIEARGRRRARLSARLGTARDLARSGRQPHRPGSGGGRLDRRRVGVAPPRPHLDRRRRAPRSKTSEARTARTSAARGSKEPARLTGSRRREDRAGDSDPARPQAHGFHALHREGAFLEVTLSAGTRLSSYEIVATARRGWHGGGVQGAGHEALEGRRDQGASAQRSRATPSAWRASRRKRARPRP